jgi:hypothetical protein
MKFQIVNVKDNKEVFGSYDVYIENTETHEVALADQVIIWEDDQESLEEMFELVMNGEW